MTTLPNICIVDVNVGIVANGKAEVCAECELECVETLQTTMVHGRVAVDDGGRIFDEYMNHLRLAGEPGVGDEFVKWLHDHEWLPDRCERVPLTPPDADPLDFEEFPRDVALARFDRSDRKYVAVAVVCAALLGPATVLNATDSDWKHHEVSLTANGVAVVHLCPSELKD